MVQWVVFPPTPRSPPKEPPCSWRRKRSRRIAAFCPFARSRWQAKFEPRPVVSCLRRNFRRTPQRRPSWLQERIGKRCASRKGKPYVYSRIDSTVVFTSLGTERDTRRPLSFRSKTVTQEFNIENVSKRQYAVK